MNYYKSKFEFVKDIVKENTTVLDLGCRNNILKKYLPASINYVGMDLFQNDDNGVNIVGNIEDGLPFDDLEFDYIIALDLFEHLNDLQKAIEESVKKLKLKGILIIQLPNLSYFPHRWDYLINGRFTKTDKYKLIHNYGLDRHRWLTTMIESDEFIKQFSTANRCDFEKFAVVSPKLRLVANLFDLIGLKEYSYSKSVIYVLEKV